MDTNVLLEKEFMNALKNAEGPNVTEIKNCNQVAAQAKTIQEVEDAFNKWLYLEDISIVKVVLATILANRLSSDPVWLFLVGSPGCSKTEILRSLKTDEFYTVSSLTQHSLISGFTIKGKKGANCDPSLLQYLDKKVLVIKDFTNVLQGDRHARDEIFGTLRDAYDGYCEKIFGSEAQKRSYTAKFGLLAGVTPEIDRYYSVSQSLGERFLKYRVKNEDKSTIIKRASQIRGEEKVMREELSSVVSGFLGSVETKNLEIPLEIEEKFIQLAHLISWLRSAVSRDGYNRNVEFLPELEVGTRIVKQFENLAVGLALVNGKEMVGEDEYKFITKIAKDTLPSKRRAILEALAGELDAQKTSHFSEIVKLSTNTTKESLEDFWLLKIVDRIGKYHSDGSVDEYTWEMRQEIKELIQRTEI